MSLFAGSELVFTHNAKDNTYMGGGYVLKSEFMEGGAPPILNMKMDGGSDGDDKRLNGRRANNKNKNKNVSSLLFDRTRAVPAGLFLMNNRQSDAQSLYDDSVIKSVLNLSNDGSDGSSSDGSSSSNDDSSSSSDDIRTGKSKSKSGEQHHRRDNNAVVSETLYDTLFKMLSPDADKRRYWANGAKTQRRSHIKNKNNNNNNNSNTRKK
jgi:hypothetical protein